MWNVEWFEWHMKLMTRLKTFLRMEESLVHSRFHTRTPYMDSPLETMEPLPPEWGVEQGNLLNKEIFYVISLREKGLTNRFHFFPREKVTVFHGKPANQTCPNVLGKTDC